MKLSEGEKLILLMLCSIQEHLKIKHPEIDTKLIKEAIFSGNLWGLKRGLPGVFHGEETPDNIVTETENILAMWERLEQSFAGLKKIEKESLAKNAALSFGGKVRFPGFDGNNESSYISVADFLVKSLNSFRHFKARDFNAHMPTLDEHRRMLAVYEPILQQVSNKDFSTAQIAEVLAAWRHPQ